MIPTSLLVIKTLWNVRQILLLSVFSLPWFFGGVCLQLLDPEEEDTTLCLTWVTVCLYLRNLETFIHLTS